jgi:ribonuclease G
MSNELLIEVGAHETRVAVLTGGRLVEVHIERAAEPGVVGNVYKGRVSRVVPGIQAAFVDIGLARDAFLFAGDLRRAEPVDLSMDDGQQGQRPEQRLITEHVKEGQELLVQVVKEPLPGKGARISLQISLPGRLLVLLPGASGVGISRRISLPDERQRLEALIQPMLPADNGLIVRTAGAGKSEKDLRLDLEWLSRTWQEIKQRSAGVNAPGLVQREMGLAMRAARDLLNNTFSAVWVEDATAYADIEQYLAEVDREMVPRVSSSTRPRRWLPSTSTRADIRKRRHWKPRLCKPTWRLQRRSHARFDCGILPASSSWTSST